jgi:hypothetical protein
MVPSSRPFNVDNPVEETNEVNYFVPYKMYSKYIHEELDDGVRIAEEDWFPLVLPPARPKSPTPAEDPMEDVRNGTPSFEDLDRSSSSLGFPLHRSQSYDPDANPQSSDEDEVFIQLIDAGFSGY